MILVDTSAWIEFLRGTGSAVALQVRSSITSEEVATTDPVMLEVMSGAHPDQVVSQRRLLHTVDFLPQHTRDDVLHAADLYRHCRDRGVTIRSLTDCLIAAIAIRNDVALLHVDRDFDRLAEHTRLRCVVPQA